MSVIHPYVALFPGPPYVACHATATTKEQALDHAIGDFERATGLPCERPPEIYTEAEFTSQFPTVGLDSLRSVEDTFPLVATTS